MSVALWSCEGYGLLSPYVQAIKNDRLYRLLKNSCFVSGHDFSRAVRLENKMGFSPCHGQSYHKSDFFSSLFSPYPSIFAAALSGVDVTNSIRRRENSCDDGKFAQKIDAQRSSAFSGMVKILVWRLPRPTTAMFAATQGAKLRIGGWRWPSRRHSFPRLPNNPC
jgi:hypothetical protein